VEIDPYSVPSFRQGAFAKKGDLRRLPLNGREPSGSTRHMDLTGTDLLLVPSGKADNPGANQRYGFNLGMFSPSSRTNEVEL
jgi:hypothetical protein